MEEISAIAKGHEAPALLQAELNAFRASTLAQRGHLLAIACRAAARLQRCRLQAGLPDPGPDPWPPSTWEFLKKHASHGS